MALRAGSVSGFTSTVFALASTAPAYSLAVSVGLLVGLADTRAPLVLLVSAVVMAVVVLCFAELNTAEPDCGTCYAWTRRAFGESPGRVVGWVTVAACVLVMANLAQVAAVYALTVVGADDLAGSRPAQGALGCALLAFMAYLAHRGITVAARVQVALLAVELVALAVFTVRAATTAPLLPPSPMTTQGYGVSYLGAFLVAVFLYWGWDSAFAVNEESTSPTRTPVRSSLLALGLLAVLFGGFTWAVTSWAGVARLRIVGEDDLLARLGTTLLGSTGGTLLVGAVLVSALASAQTTILPAARSLLSMARAGATPAGLASTGASGSPSVATWAFTVLSGAVYLGLLVTSDAVLADSVAATGVLVALYYAATCAAVPFYFRGAARTRPVRRVLLPVLASTCFAAVLALSATELSRTSVLVVLVVIVAAAAASLLRPLTPTAPASPAPSDPPQLARRDPR